MVKYSTHWVNNSSFWSCLTHNAKSEISDTSILRLKKQRKKKRRKDGGMKGQRTISSVYLCQVRKEDLTGASPQNVPVTPCHKLLTVFF